MPNKILIVGPAWVGDMVMAQCLFKLLKARRPDCVIDVLAPSWSLPLLARMPEVSDAIVMPLKHGELKLRERFRLGKNLREKKYQQAILLPNSFKSALIPFFARIPLRTGWRREMRSLLLNDARQLDEKKYPLMIERFMALGLSAHESLPQVYPLPKLHISSATQKAALEKHQLIRGNHLLALCPGAEFGPAKRWPAEHYAEVANAKLNEGWDVWLFGSAKDAAVTETIMQLTNHRCIDLAGKTQLEEAVDLLALADVIVSNDSGLMHIAAALHKPLIAIYGPTSAAYTPPLHTSARILSQQFSCQPCFQRECPLQHHRCMRELHPKEVLNACSTY